VASEIGDAKAGEGNGRKQSESVVNLETGTWKTKKTRTSPEENEVNSNMKSGLKRVEPPTKKEELK